MFALATPAFDSLFMGCVLNLNTVHCHNETRLCEAREGAHTVMAMVMA